MSTRPKRQLNYNNHGPSKQASNQSLSTTSNPFGSSSSSSSSSMHLTKKRRLNNQFKVSLNNPNQCKSPSSLSTTSTSSSNQITDKTKTNNNYLLVSKAGKLQQMAQQKKQEQQQQQQQLKKKGAGVHAKKAYNKQLLQKANSKATVAGKRSKTNAGRKVNGGVVHRPSTRHDEDDDENNEDDDDEEENDDDVSISNDEIEFDTEDMEQDDAENEENNSDRFEGNGSDRFYDDSNSPLGPKKLDSDMETAVDDYKAPHSSSNETESINQIDDEENEDPTIIGKS